MSLPRLPDAAIELGASAGDWRAAVRLAGRALERSGAALAGYADEMIRMIEEHGPYIVIAPGLALVHARPGPDVLADGLAVVTLSDAVRFGHPHNDPVEVVLGLAMPDPSEHVPTIAALANVFNDAGVIGRIAAARHPDEVRAAMHLQAA